MELWTAFTIGLVGSLHCIGMCGPIALSLPYQASSSWATLRNVLTYNFGRIITYGIIGILPGLLGTGIFLAGFQKNTSIALGLILLLAAFFSFRLPFQALPLLRRFYDGIRQQLGVLLQNRSQKTFLSIGLLNGFLPCGMVYMAVAGAITQPSIFKGMGYMMLFGLGTLPLMVLLSLTGHWVGLSLRQRLRRIVPVFYLLFALFFIARGLNVELPIDLRLLFLQKEIPVCH